MPRPDSYAVQPSCMNCHFRFEAMDYDSGIDYYCTKDGEKRPKCGSVSLEEMFDYPEHDAPHDAWLSIPDVMAWNKWSEDHAVQACGVCMNWKKAS